MKIVEEYNDNSIAAPIEIISALYVNDYVIQIKFSDGSEKSVNFQPFLSKSFHPAIKKYLDKNLFQQFEVIDGNLNWYDYDMIFPIAELHEGKVE